MLVWFDLCQDNNKKFKRLKKAGRVTGEKMRMMRKKVVVGGVEQLKRNSRDLFLGMMKV